jgi:hypothetical protein
MYAHEASASTGENVEETTYLPPGNMHVAVDHVTELFYA